MPDVKLSQLAAQSAASVAAGAALWTHKGHIDGLKLEWVSGTSLRVTSGSAYVPSLGFAVDVAAAITKASLALTASTWYHVYLFLNAGVPDIEIVTTAPAAAYSGTARAKTGDTSRRYLGSVKTSGTAAIWNFIQSGSRVSWLVAAGGAPFRVLSIGQSTSIVTVSAAAVVPVTSRLMQVKFTNSDPGFPARFLTSDTGLSVPDSLVSLPPSSNIAAFMDFPTNGSQEIQYFMNGGSSGGGAGATVDVLGYTYER